MDSWRKYNISKVISYAEKESQLEARPYCYSAMNEFNDIKARILLNHRTKIEPVYAFLDNITHMRYIKKEKTEEAISIFNTYIKPFLEEEERKAAGGATVDQRIQPAPNAESRPTEHFLGSKEYTKQPLERGVEGLVLAFRNLYFQGAWDGAFKDLLAIKKSVRMTIECLLRIVKKAFEVNMREAELQLNTAEECAKQIVRNGTLSPGHCQETGVNKSTNELIHRYRYIHADLATGRLQKILLQEVETLLYDIYNLQFKENTSLGLFTNECAEVTWLMCVEDPPINMVHEENLERLDYNNYELVRGKPYKAIILPALRQEGYERILAPGILWIQE